jgi:hypothetical protein
MLINPRMINLLFINWNLIHAVFYQSQFSGLRIAFFERDCCKHGHPLSCLVLPSRKLKSLTGYLSEHVICGTFRVVMNPLEQITPLLAFPDGKSRLFAVIESLTFRTAVKIAIFYELSQIGNHQILEKNHDSMVFM